MHNSRTNYNVDSSAVAYSTLTEHVNLAERGVDAEQQLNKL